MGALDLRVCLSGLGFRVVGCAVLMLFVPKNLHDLSML